MAVQVVETPDGTRHYGETIDGVFVPFAAVTAARVKQLVERGKDLSSKLESDDPEEVKRAQDAADLLPISVKTKSGNGGEK